MGTSVVAAGALIRLPWLVQRNGGDAVPLLVGVVLTLVIVTGVFAWLGRRMRRQVAVVTRARGGATVVLAMTTPELLDEAHRLGVSTRRISATGSEHAVLAVLPDRVEVWFRGDGAPRWWVDLSSAVVTTEEVRIQLGTFDQLRVAGPMASLDVIPVDPRVTRLLSRAARRAELDSALGALRHRGTSGSRRQVELPT